MAKGDSSAPVVEADDIALDNWAEAKSKAVGRQVEALSAFYKICQANGLGRATAEKFDADFEAFLNAPA